MENKTAFSHYASDFRNAKTFEEKGACYNAAVDTARGKLHAIKKN